MNAVLKTYKTQVASRYIPLAPEDLGRRMLESEGYHVSRKLDGHLYFLCADKDGVWLENHGGNVIEELPLIEGGEEGPQGHLLHSRRRTLHRRWRRAHLRFLGALRAGGRPRYAALRRIRCRAIRRESVLGPLEGGLRQGGVLARP